MAQALALPSRGIRSSGLPTRHRMVWLAALIVAANGFFPALWILFTSLKTETELMRVPITILPASPTIANYIRVFVDQPILTFLWNSFAVATLSTLLCVAVSAAAAYALVPAPPCAEPDPRGHARRRHVPADHPHGSALPDHARPRPAQHLDVPRRALCGPVASGLHAGPDLLLPGYPARPRERRHDRWLHAPRRTL